MSPFHFSLWNWPFRLRTVRLALLALSAWLPVWAQSPSEVNEQPLALQSISSSRTIHLVVGHSRVLTSEIPLNRVYVGDPTVLHTFTSGKNEVLITAKSPGTSSLVLWDAKGTHYVQTVSCDLDALALASVLSEAFPQSSVHVQASQGKLTLSGAVQSPSAVEAAGKLAASYSKDVVNNLQIAPPREKQVELKRRIVEVDRTKLEQFGWNFFSTGNNLSGITTQQFGSTQYTPNPSTGSDLITFDPLNLLFASTSSKAGISVRDLEQKDVLQVLAEPTLTTVSGQPARFLSGGEFPFPVVQGGTANSTAITIQFRPYGVKVEFTPVVNADNSIHLKVSPEVSTLDYSNAVTISGFTIPALSTRRAETEVEIRNGESFAVSGLLDHRTTEALSKLPGIGDIPILGQLFRSKNLNHSVVELVVVVTARIVDPLHTPEPVHEPALPIRNLNDEHFDRAFPARDKVAPGDPTTPTKLGGGAQ